MKISRTIVNETKRNIYVLVGIWIIAGVEEPSLFGNLSWTLHYNYVIVHFIHNNCPYFFLLYGSSDHALTVLATLLITVAWWNWLSGS